MFIQLKYNIIGTGRTKALPKGETKLNYFQKDIETMPRKKIEELQLERLKRDVYKRQMMNFAALVLLIWTFAALR